MIKNLLAAAALLALVPAHAGIGITSASFTYAESFDTLAAVGTTAQPWANDSTLAGWSLFTKDGLPITTYLPGNGSANTGSFYSYGTTGSVERALGGAASGGVYFGSPGSGAVAGWMAVSFTNLSVDLLDSFSFSYAGEQWRNGGNTSVQLMSLEYGFGATFATVVAWNPMGASADFASPVFSATAAAVDGNTAGRVAGLGGSYAVNWAPGETLWVRFTERNDAGNDHGLAVDDVTLSVTAVPEPSQWALMLAGVAALGFIARRRS